MIESGSRLSVSMIFVGIGRFRNTKSMSSIDGRLSISVIHTDGSWTRVEFMADGVPLDCVVFVPRGAPVCVSVACVVDQRLHVAHQWKV